MRNIKWSSLFSSTPSVGDANKESGVTPAARVPRSRGKLHADKGLKARESTGGAPSGSGMPPRATPPQLRDRSGEEAARIAYPFPGRKEGYADPEGTDFATQAGAALRPVAENFTAQSAEHGDKPPVDVVQVDVYAAYQEALPQFRQRLETSGFMKAASTTVRHGILSYAERRHVRENVEYKRQDRAKLVPLSETGRTEGPKAPNLTRPIRAMRKEETMLAQGRRLHAYAFERLRDQSLALSKMMVPAGKNAAGLIDQWRMNFHNEKEVQAFFKREFGIAPKSLTKQDEIRWMVEEGLRRAGDQVTPVAAEEVKGLKFKTRTDVESFFASKFDVVIGKPSAEEKAALLARRGVEVAPLGQTVFENAVRFKQTAWDVGQNPKIHGRPTSFVLADGSTCRDTSTKGQAAFEVALGDGRATLAFKRPATGSAFELELTLVDEADGDGEPQIRKISQADPNFMSKVRSTFSSQMLDALFGDAKPTDLSKVGTFQEIFGQMRAGIELENKLDDWLYSDLKDAVRKRLKDAGDPVTFQGTGNSYNKALYGENWGNEARSKVMEQIFKLAGEGDVFAHGSCGFQQEALWMFGGHMVAYQDDGKTYRYSDHGGDPLEVEAKQTYQSIKPFTDTAGGYEKKMPIDGARDGEAADGWVQREVAPLTLSFKSPDADGPQRTMLLRDAAGKPIIASANLRIASSVHGPAGSRNSPPVRLTLEESAPPDQVLADDLGRPVLDADGQPVRRLEEVVLEAVIDGQPMTPERINEHFAAVKARMRENNAVDTQARNSELVLDDLARKRVREAVTYQVAQVTRWERVPLTQPGADGRDEPMSGPNGLLHTYRKVVHDHPSPDLLTDRVYAQIHCVHSQNGLNVSYEDQLLAPGVEVVGHGIPREGVQADTPLTASHRPAATSRFKKPFAAYQPPGTLREKAVVESLEFHNGRTTQPHSDMFKGEAKGRLPDGNPTTGEDPLVPFEIKHEIPAELHGSRAGIHGAITSGIALRDHKNARQELKQKLADVRHHLDDDTRAVRSRHTLYNNALPNHVKTSQIQKRKTLLTELEQPEVERQKQEIARDIPTAERATARPKNPVAHQRRFVSETEVPQGLPTIVEIADEQADQTREQAQAQVRYELEQLDAFITDLAAAENADSPPDMERVVKRYFRAWPDKLSTTAEAKAASGLGDVFEAGALGAELGKSAAAATTLSVGNLLGSLMLGIAGAEGMKDAVTDMRRLRHLIKPLQEHQRNLQALQRELSELPGDEPSPALAATVDPSLKGVTARLQAANRQMADSISGFFTSGLLTTAGGTGVAGAATTIAGATAASKVLGGVYGGLVMSFGAITAAQGLYRLKQLQGLPQAVERELGKDSALRVGLITLLEHERAARKDEIASRTVLAATGAASLAFSVTGAVGAVPSAGSSIPLMVAGVAMGAATGAAFRPVMGRHRGLHAIGAVERTTNLPTTFLEASGQLNHLVNKLNNQAGMATHFQRKIIDAHMPYSYRAHRAVAKAVPSHDRRQVAQCMIDNPQAVADDSMQFMLRASQFELHYLRENKGPALQAELRALEQEFLRTPANGTPGGDEAAPRRQMLVRQLKVKSDMFVAEMTRLQQLLVLEGRLNKFTRNLDKEFLSDPALAKEWKGLQVDFIIAHDLAAEAMSRGRMKEVQAQTEAAIEAGEADTGKPLKEALRENIDRRFAKVFTQCYPDKIAYERRGALELARLMFMGDANGEADPDVEALKIDGGFGIDPRQYEAAKGMIAGRLRPGPIDAEGDGTLGDRFTEGR